MTNIIPTKLSALYQALKNKPVPDYLPVVAHTSGIHNCSPDAKTISSENMLRAMSPQVLVCEQDGYEPHMIVMPVFNNIFPAPYGRFMQRLEYFMLNGKGEYPLVLFPRNLGHTYGNGYRSEPFSQNSVPILSNPGPSVFESMECLNLILVLSNESVIYENDEVGSNQ